MARFEVDFVPSFTHLSNLSSPCHLHLTDNSAQVLHGEFCMGILGPLACALSPSTVFCNLFLRAVDSLAMVLSICIRGLVHHLDVTCMVVDMYFAARKLSGDIWNQLCSQVKTGIRFSLVPYPGLLSVRSLMSDSVCIPSWAQNVYVISSLAADCPLGICI